MINTKLFGEELKKLGFQIYTGVPCSFLKNLINYVINDGKYIAAANEGDAIAIAAGAYLGGTKAVVLMQNSGLTNAASPLISLNATFKLPVLGFVTLRGEKGVADEPQHELMGLITTKMLKLMQVKWEYLSDDFEEAKRQLTRANRWIEKKQPFLFVVKKNTFETEPLHQREQWPTVSKTKINKNYEDQLPSRYEALGIINSLKDKNTVQIAATGKTGRELYQIEDADNNFYMVGSMGCAGSLGLGLALARKDKDIIVIDGDGALLMRMGSLATNGYYNPCNMLHILLDNNTYDSTGGQSTVSGNVNFVDAASSCGYARAIYIHNLTELKNSIQLWKQEKGLTFMYLKISKGSQENLGRPQIKPYEVKERLRVFING